MIEVNTVAVRKNFSDYINRVMYGKERVILMRRGAEVAVIVPLDDLQLLEKMEELMDVRDAEIALADAKKNGTTSLEQLKKELGID